MSPDQLRRLQLSFWGFDGQTHDGVLIVNQSAVQTLTDVFRQLYGQHFPIRQMQPIDAYGGSDDASTAADNTSAFNCRNAVADGPPQWSVHAYGLAIDINPVENPYVLDGTVMPPAGSAYTDRSSYRAGMAVPGGILTGAFSAAGWYWGGTWASPDYQHFSSTGG